MCCLLPIVPIPDHLQPSPPQPFPRGLHVLNGVHFRDVFS